MGQLTNQYVSQSYQGLLKLQDSTTGVTSTLQYVQDGVGNNIPIQVSTSSVVITGSFRGDGSGLTGITANVDSGSLVTTASFNAYTSSNDGKVNSLISQTGSYVTEAESGSFMITGSVAGDTLTFTKGDGSQFSLQVNTGSLPSGVVSGSQQIVDLGFATTSSVNSLSQSIAVTDLAQNGRLTSLETATSSLQSQINQKLDTGSFNTYTSSQASYNNFLVDLIATKVDTGSFNSYTSSNDSKVNSLISATGSYATTSSVTSLSQSIAVTDLAQDGRLTSLETFTGSINNNFVSEAEFGTYTSSMNSFTTSIDGRVDALEIATGSLQNQINQKLDTGSFNSYTSSNDAKVNSLINSTGSYVTETESGSFMTTGSVAGDTLTFTKGDGSQFSLQISVATGSLPAGVVSGSQQIVDLGFATTSSVNTKLDTGSFNTYSGNTLNLINTKLDSSSFNSYTSSNDAKVNSLISATGSYATTGSNIFQGTQTITGSLNVTGEITALSASITYLETIYQTSSVLFSSGSNILGDEAGDTQTLYGTVRLPNGPLSITGSATASAGFFGDLQGTASYATQALSASYAPSNPLPAGLVSGSSQISYTGITDVPSGIVSGSGQVSYTGITDVPVGIVSGSQQIVNLGFLETSSFNTYSGNTLNLINQKLDTGSFNSYTSSNDSKVNSLISQTGSYVTETESGSFMITGSVSGPTSTFTKGDGSQFSLTVNNVQSASHAINADTASFATNVVSSSYAENAGTASFARDIFVVGKNTTGIQINKGTVVRIGGSTGDQALIITASWEDDNNSANTLGILAQDIANDASGSVITNGTLLGINTSGFTAGDILYLSSSGQYTNVIPPSPYHEVRLGQVLRVQQNQGSMYVSIQNGYELSELHDVDIQSPVVGDVLTYVSGAYGQWENKTVAELGYLQTSSFNTYTGNTLNLINQKLDTGSFNSYTSSTDGRLNSLESFTGSIDTNFVSEVEFGAYTSSNDGKVNSLINATGSYATTGSNTFIGNQIVNGLVTQNIGAPATDTQKDFITVSGATIDGKPYNYVNVGIVDYPSFGDNFKDAFAVEYYDSLSYNYGTEFLQNGKRISANVFASGSGRQASFSLRDQYNGSTSFNMYADTMEIGQFAAGTNTRIGIGHTTLPLVDIKAIDVNITGSVKVNGSITGSLQGTASFATTASFALNAPTVDTGSLMKTGSVLGNVLTFTKGDGSTFDLTVATGSGGGSIDTGSFATTGSNTFIGNQVITGSVLISGSATNDLTVIGNIVSTGSGVINTNNTNTQYLGSTFGGNIGVYNVSNNTEIGLALDGNDWTTNWSTGPILYVNNTPGDTYEGVFGFQNKTNYTDGRITALKPMVFNSGSTITGSFNVTGSSTLSGNGGFPLSVDGTINSKRLHFNQNPFNNDPSSNLGAIRLDGFNQSFYITNYDLADFANKQSVVGLFVNTGSNTVNTYLQSLYNGTTAKVDLTNLSGSRTFIVDVDSSAFTGSVNISGSTEFDLTIQGRQLITGPTASVGTSFTPQLLISSSDFNNRIGRSTSYINKAGRTFGSGYSYGRLDAYQDINSQAIINIGVFDEPNFVTDIELLIQVDTGSGIQFQDIDNSNYGYETFLKIGPNTGVGNPPPLEFKRNVEVTGSLNVSGGVTGSFYGDGSGLTGITASAPSNVATTGSNVFIGNQTITGSVLISGSAAVDLKVVGNIVSTGSSLINTDNVNIQYLGSSFGGNLGVLKISDNTEIGLALDGASWTGNWSTGPILYVNNNPGDTYDAVFGFQNKANYSDGKVTVLKPMTFNSGITGSLTVTGQAIFQGNNDFPVNVQGTITSKRFSFNGNPFNSTGSGTFGSLNYDGTNTQLQYVNGDFGTPQTSSYTNLTTNTGSNLTQVVNGADYAGTSAKTTLANTNGTRTFTVDVNRTSITGSLAYTMPTIDITVNTTGSIDLNVSNTFLVNDDGNPAGGHLIFSNHRDGQQVSVLINNTGTDGQSITLEGARSVVGTNATINVDTGYNLLQGVCYGGIFYGTFTKQ